MHRRSYMSAHVLLNLLKELGKRDKMRGLPRIKPRILSLFRKKFNSLAFHLFLATINSIIQELEC